LAASYRQIKRLHLSVFRVSAVKILFCIRPEFHLLAYHPMRDYIINKERRRQNDEAYVC
jgi:hypothetical protein